MLPFPVISDIRIGARARTIQLPEDTLLASEARRSNVSLFVGCEETENIGGKLAVAGRHLGPSPGWCPSESPIPFAAGRSSPACHRGVSPHIVAVRNYKLTYWYVSNDGMVPNGGETVFGLPYHFPARPSILARHRAQVYDCTRFFGTWRVEKKFFPDFSRTAGNGRRPFLHPPRQPSARQESDWRTAQAR